MVNKDFQYTVLYNIFRQLFIQCIYSVRFLPFFFFLFTRNMLTLKEYKGMHYEIARIFKTLFKTIEIVN